MSTNLVTRHRENSGPRHRLERASQAISNARRRNVAMIGATAITAAVGLVVPIASHALAGSGGSASWHIDAGGPGLTSSDGTVWTADNGFRGGSTTSTTHLITGTHNSDLMATARAGMSSYALPVAPGTYNVTLAMAETVWMENDKRKFSATVEGVDAVKDLDLYEHFGAYREVDAGLTVAVTDGILSINFQARWDQATVSAIIVEPTDSSPSPTVSLTSPAPTPTTATPTPTTTTATPTPTTASPTPTTATPTPTTASPAPTPTPTPSTTPPSTGGKLTWAPPTLVNPISMAYPEGAAPLKLDSSRDYILKLPSNRALNNRYGLTINGGHNVVIIGGAVNVGTGVPSLGIVARRGAYFKDQTGTLFVEGVRFQSPSSAYLMEGIDLSQSKGATVVIQNVVVEHLVGSQSTNHADGLQTWAGPKRLLIDRLSIDTGYQGMFLLPNQHLGGSAPAQWDFRHIYLHGQSSAKYLMWKPSAAFNWKISNIYLLHDSGRARSLMLYPSGDPLFASVAMLSSAATATARVADDPRQYGSAAGSTYHSGGYA